MNRLKVILRKTHMRETVNRQIVLSRRVHYSDECFTGTTWVRTWKTDWRDSTLGSVRAVMSC